MIDKRNDKNMTYSPNTKPAYTFTRPYIKGQPTDYMRFLMSMYRGSVFTLAEANMWQFPGFAVTVQNLRMAGLIELVKDSNSVLNGKLKLTAKGLEYMYENYTLKN